MKIELDLLDKSKIQSQVQVIQEQIDELLGVIEKQQSELKNNADVMLNAQDRIETLLNTNKDLVEAIKNVHIYLGSQSDKFKGDEGFKILMEGLGVFIMSSGAIKAGVVNEPNL